MEGLFQVFILLIFCVYSESSIRMQRDFTYPKVDEFDVYWNVPTFLCHKHGVNFEEVTKKFGILSNDGDHFRGNKINILYDPGLFPAMMKNAKGRALERNGGIPQLGNLTLHLESFREAMGRVVPEDFGGVGIIDFEAWRPVFRQNWNDQVVYKVLSKELEKQYHPQWPENKIDTYASHHFEMASRIFMETTLQLAKLLRPNATWGYYAFPYCYNYREGNRPHCADIVEKENNRIQWLFDESTAIFPSLYMSSKLSVEEHKKFVIGRLNEAWRMASRVSTRHFPKVYPYIWFQYYDSPNFLLAEDMYVTLETTRKYKMGGVIIWGATANVASQGRCQMLHDYVEKVLGPVVIQVRENIKREKDRETNFGVDEDQYTVDEMEDTFYKMEKEINKANEEMEREEKEIEREEMEY